MEIAAIIGRLAATPGDLLLIVADEVTTAGQALSACGWSWRAAST